MTAAYGAMMLAGFALSAAIWTRMFRSRGEMAIVYVFGLVGALLGAKVLFWIAELPWRWGDGDVWMQALVGRTVLGALLGGYAGVEVGKKLIDHHEPTGDYFACIVPLGIAIGRVGCLLHGCCLGVTCTPSWWTIEVHGAAHYPAAAGELAFNLLCAMVLWPLARAKVGRGQLFHAYLVAYGLFRFGHEFARDTVRWEMGLSPYQVAAAALVLLGIWRFAVRHREAQVHALPNPI
jgi:phosphatidylglycerol:prolipoprotein diacylglycerol transferase